MTDRLTNRPTDGPTEKWLIESRKTRLKMAEIERKKMAERERKKKCQKKRMRKKKEKRQEDEKKARKSNKQKIKKKLFYGRSLSAVPDALL